MGSQVIEKVSKAEFCRQAGLSTTRLKKLISSGLPLTRDRKVPLKRALAWIEANVDPARRNHWSPNLPENGKVKPSRNLGEFETAAKRGGKKCEETSAFRKAPETGFRNLAETAGFTGASLNDFRRQREAQKVAAGEIELAKARGELIERASVKKFLAERARMERDQWISWASAASGRLAGALGPGVDTGRLFAALEGEVRDQLRRLAERPLEGGDAESHVS